MILEFEETQGGVTTTLIASGAAQKTILRAFAKARFHAA